MNITINIHGKSNNSIVDSSVLYLWIGTIVLTHTTLPHCTNTLYLLIVKLFFGFFFFPLSKCYFPQFRRLFFVRSFVCFFVCLFVCLFVCVFVCLLTNSFIYLFIYSLIRLFINLFIYLFMYCLFIHLFIHTPAYFYFCLFLLLRNFL